MSAAPRVLPHALISVGSWESVDRGIGIVTGERFARTGQ
jgi:hypothetical protein